jgi:hypothetical protein
MLRTICAISRINTLLITLFPGCSIGVAIHLPPGLHSGVDADTKGPIATKTTIRCLAREQFGRLIEDALELE